MGDEFTAREHPLDLLDGFDHDGFGDRGWGQHLDLACFSDRHGDLKRFSTGDQVDGVNVAVTGFGLNVKDVAVIGGDLGHRLTDVGRAIGRCALRVEGIGVGVDRQLDGERQRTHEAGTGLDVSDSQLAIGRADQQIERASDLVGVVDNDAFHHPCLDGDAVSVQCSVDCFDVGGVGSGGGVGRVRPGLLEHGVDCGAEISANG